MTAVQKAAVAAFGKAVLQAFKEVETAIGNETFLRSGLGNWRASRTDHVEAVRLGFERYRAGNLDLQNFLQLQEERLESEAKVIEIEAALLNNRIDLYLALGGGY